MRTLTKKNMILMIIIGIISINPINSYAEQTKAQCKKVAKIEYKGCKRNRTIVWGGALVACTVSLWWNPPALIGCHLGVDAAYAAAMAACLSDYYTDVEICDAL